MFYIYHSQYFYLEMSLGPSYTSLINVSKVVWTDQGPPRKDMIFSTHRDRFHYLYNKIEERTKDN